MSNFQTFGGENVSKKEFNFEPSPVRCIVCEEYMKEGDEIILLPIYVYQKSNHVMATNGNKCAHVDCLSD